MKYTYDESYLNDIQKNLGFFFQSAICLLKFSPEQVQSIFLESEVPHQIEIANPDFLCGKSGFELLIIACKNISIDKSVTEALNEPFYPQAEYWSGSVLAYYQWQTGVPFKDILEKFPLQHILDNYQIMHEADFSKMVALMNEVVL